MKGCLTSQGYMGQVGESYILFPTEEEYIEYIREREEETNED